MSALPLQKRSNLGGFLYAAHKMHFALMGRNEAQYDALLEHLSSIKNRGDAKAYLSKLMPGIHAALAAVTGRTPGTAYIVIMYNPRISL